MKIPYPAYIIHAPMKNICLFLMLAGLLAAGCLKSNNALQTSGVSVISATYGSGTTYADVTDRVDELLGQPHAGFYVHPKALGSDPTPGWNKTLIVVYEFKRHRYVYSAGEGEKLNIPILLAEAQSNP